ncbi:MAG: putative dsRNA-binding protein [Merdibacter sp.]
MFLWETYDEKDNPVWECTCIIPDYDLKTKGTSSKKKEAKKDAAFEALERVLSES